MSLYVVEHEYREPLTDEKHNEETMRADPCLRQYGVTWKTSYLAIDRLKMICEFEADSAEQVRDALRRADVAFVKVWPTHKYSAKEA
jgi:hypothetical protein